MHRSVPSVFHKIYIVYIVVWGQTRYFTQTTLCLLTILIAAKGSGIAQLRYIKNSRSGIFAKNIDKYF